MRKKLGLILIFILLLTAFAAQMTVGAQSSPQQITLRVAFPLQNGLSQKDAQGRYSGYTYDYLMKIAQFTGWKYEIVEPTAQGNDGINEMFDKLEKGEVDLYGGVKKHSSVIDRIDFPELCYGYAYTVLGILESNAQLNEANFNNLAVRVAVLKSSGARKEQLIQFCENKNITLTFVECDTESEMLDAMKKGLADAYLGVDLGLIEGTKILANFAPEPFYLATTKGNTEILSMIDSAIAKLNQADPYFVKNLYAKYFLSDNYVLNFTEEEKLFMQTAPTIKALIASQAPPFQYGTFDKPRGASIAYLKAVSEKTGLKFEYVAAAPTENLKTALEKYQPHIVLGIPSEDTLAQSHGLILSKDYFESEMSLFYKRNININDLTGKTAALPRGALRMDNIKDAKIVYYDNVHQCIEAVNSGRADYGYANNYTVNYYLTKDVYTKIISVPMPDYKKSCSFGIVSSLDQSLNLLTVMNKVIRSIPTDTMTSYIVTELSAASGNYTFLNYLKANSLEAILIAVSIVVFLSLCVFLAVFIKVKANKKIVALTKNIRGGMLEFKVTDDVHFSYVSDGFYTMLGLTRETINSDNWKAYFDVCELYEAVLQVKAAIEQKRRFHCELSFKAAEGLRYLNVEGSRIGNSSPPVIQAICTDITKTKRYLNQVEALARTDMLTGIYNKDTVEKTISEKMNAVESPILVIFDVDNFKTVNDTLGHEKGDEVLKETALTIASKLSQNAFVGRLGGDEFIALLHSTTKDVVENKIRNIKFDLDQKTRFLNLPFAVTLSVGLLDIKQYSVTNFSEAYKMTDKAMYNAKKNGKNAFVWYQGETDL